MSNNMFGVVLALVAVVALGGFVWRLSAIDLGRDAWFSDCTQKHPIAECAAGLKALRDDRR
jgi:hypothetical protein